MNIDVIEILIAVAWADGAIQKEEMDILNELENTNIFSDQEKLKIGEWLKSPNKDIEPIAQKITDIGEQKLVLQQAILVVLADNVVHTKEKEVIQKLISTFQLPQKEVEDVCNVLAELLNKDNLLSTLGLEK
jgi:tellurite resistance protein